MIRPFAVVCLLVAFISTSVGLYMITNSMYSSPPIPSGWVIGMIFVDIGLALCTTGGLAVRFIKKKRALWMTTIVVGAFMLTMGIRNLIRYPLEITPCPCESNFYGPNCLPCPACNVFNSNGCDDDVQGTGECLCKTGFGGETCSVCSPTFDNDIGNCDTCKRGWRGPTCSQCDIGYGGPNCDSCLPNWIPETDSKGTLCQTCKPNKYGRHCRDCPQCDAHDSLAVCKDNAWHNQNVYKWDICTVTSQTCSDQDDCPTHNCKGQCVDGIVSDGQICETDSDCFFGTCQYKTCCLEEKYGDGTCDCKRSGYWGPLCTECPGFDGIYSSTVCGGHGTCAAAYAGDAYSHLQCECNPEGDAAFPTWSGHTCGCLKSSLGSTCSQCSDGHFGEDCKACPGGVGISQCNRHGKCDDGLTGNGTCTCDVDIKFNGLGGWGGLTCDRCHSGDFWGSKCKTCPGIMMVGCQSTNDDGSFLATLPGSGNCIASCADKTCNNINGICE